MTLRAQRGRVLMLVWAGVSVVVGVVLWTYVFLDLLWVGDAAALLNSDQFTPRVNRVTYTLFGLTYLHGDQVLTGPHRSFLLILSWLLLTTGVMWTVWWQTGVDAARRVMRTAGLSLIVLVVGGGLALGWAEQCHNTLLQPPATAQPNELFSRTSASVSLLELWRCDERDATGRCHGETEGNFPNPAPWGLGAIFLTAGVGFWRAFRAE